ncbi:hypothetical protein TIFTF001_024780 [Ficus carica]|uniref:Uncharacterized protein n=1 Tax=Ficus carica TaxID=3494 RepID=A0AA88B0W2_FICCA|nr:hypothetical protein TIFTF001_024780 [Ficus carica]
MRNSSNRRDQVITHARSLAVTFFRFENFPVLRQQLAFHFENVSVLKQLASRIKRARERKTYQLHGRRCGRLRSGVVSGGWVSRKRLEGGVAAASRGEREKERRKRELVVESRPAEMRGDRERERPKREWNGGEVGEKMEGGGTAEEMGFEGEFGETRVKEARE